MTSRPPSRSTRRCSAKACSGPVSMCSIAPSESTVANGASGNGSCWMSPPTRGRAHPRLLAMDRGDREIQSDHRMSEQPEPCHYPSVATPGLQDGSCRRARESNDSKGSRILRRLLHLRRQVEVEPLVVPVFRTGACPGPIGKILRTGRCTNGLSHAVVSGEARGRTLGERDHPGGNRAGIVRRAMASVRSQGVDDVEIIAVDDGSTDETRDEFDALRAVQHHRRSATAWWSVDGTQRRGWDRHRRVAVVP